MRHYIEYSADPAITLKINATAKPISAEVKAHPLLIL